MGLWELFVIAVGLSMDAFAVSIGKGLSVAEVKPRHAATVGLYFGGFQAAMPLVGYLLGSRFGTLITDYDHWVAFLFLAAIGGKMVYESRKDERVPDNRFDVQAMLPLAIATSIDALAVGVSLAFLQVDILPAVAAIGIITLVVSAVGLKVGNVFGLRYRSRAEVFGGVILIGIGLKILLDHLGVI